MTVNDGDTVILGGLIAENTIEITMITVPLTEMTVSASNARRAVLAIWKENFNMVKI